MALNDDVLNPDPGSGIEPRGLRLFKTNEDAYREDVLPRVNPQVAPRSLGDAMGLQVPQQQAAGPRTLADIVGLPSTPSQGPSSAPSTLADVLGLTPVQAKAPAPEQGDFSRGLSVSGKQLKQTAYGTAALIGDTAGVNALRDWGMKGYKAAEEEVQAISKQSDSFTSAFETGELGKWLTYSSGYLLGQVAELGVASLAGAAVGSAVAPGAGTVGGAVTGAVQKGAVQTGVRSFVGKMIDKQAADNAAKLVAGGMAKEAAEKVAVEAATKSVYRTIGATTANTFLNATQELGSIYGDAVEEAARKGEEYSLGRVWLAGIAATAVDTWADSKAVGKFLGAFGGDKAMRGIAMEALKGGFREGMTEGVQTAIERWGADKDLTSKEAFREYIDSAAVGILGGGIAGGSSGAINKFFKPDEAKGPGTVEGETDPLGGQTSAKKAPNLEETPGLRPQEFLDSLRNMDAMAYLYSTADETQRRDIEKAVQRANLIGEFNQAVGVGDRIQAGRQMLEQEPEFVDLFRTELTKYANTPSRSTAPKVGPVKKMTSDEQLDRLEEANQALDQNLSTTRPGVNINRQATQAEAKTDETAKGQAPVNQEPPLAPGMTRLYHGSATPGRIDGPAWFSTSREYAQNYRPGAELQFVDYPTAKVNAALDPDGYGQTVDKGFTWNVELDSSVTGPRKVLSAAPAQDTSPVTNGQQRSTTADQKQSAPKLQYKPGAETSLRTQFGGFGLEFNEERAGRGLSQLIVTTPNRDSFMFYGLGKQVDNRPNVRSAAELGSVVNLPEPVLKSVQSWLLSETKEQRNERGQQAAELLGKMAEPTQQTTEPDGRPTPPAQTEVEVARENLKNAAADLFDVASEALGTKLNITGQKYTVADLPPALAKVMEAVIKLGYVKFKDASRELMKRMRENKSWASLADRVTPAMLRDAYNKAQADGKETPEQVAAVGSGELVREINKPQTEDKKAGPANAELSNTKLPEPAAKVAAKVAEAKKPQGPDLGERTERGKRVADLQERLKSVRDEKVESKAKGLLRVGRLEQAEKVVDDHFKKESQPDRADLVSSRRRLELLRMAKNKFGLPEMPFENTTVDAKIAELLDPANEPTASNVKFAQELIQAEAARVMRALLVANKPIAAQRVFKVFDIAYRGINEGMQRARQDLAFVDDDADTESFERKSDPNAKPISAKDLEKYPAISRYIESLKDKASKYATRMDLGAMSPQKLAEVEKAWDLYFKKYEGQGKLELKGGQGSRPAPLNERQQRLDTRLSRILEAVTGSKILREGLESLRQRIKDLDEQIKSFDTMTVEERGRTLKFYTTRTDDPMRGLFGIFDQSNYALDEEGFRADRTMSDRDFLVAERARLAKDLQLATQDSIKGRASRLDRAMELVQQQMLDALKIAVDAGMSFQEAAAVAQRYGEITTFRDLNKAAETKISEERKRLMDLGMGAKQAEQEARQKYESLLSAEESIAEQERELAGSPTMEMFPEDKLVARVASGEISPQQAAVEGEVTDQRELVVSAMRELARQIGASPSADKLLQAAAWISSNMRAGGLAFGQVVEAFRANGLDMPMKLIKLTVPALRTRMLDYAKQHGGGYAPREAWLRSMDEALDFYPELIQNHFTDGEVAMYQEWKDRRDKIVDRRNLGKYGDANLLFNKYPLSMMRNPSLITNDRERLALTNNVPDLVEAWHRDLKLALDKWPDSRTEMLDPLSDAEVQAHEDWTARRERELATQAAIIEKSKYYLALPQIQGLTPEQLERFKLDIIKADLADLDLVLDNANAMAYANQMGDGTTVDPETGEIISPAEQMRASIVDDMLLQDQNTQTLAEVYGTSDQRQLNFVRQAMDDGTADATDREAGFARVAGEGMRTQAVREFDVNDFEANQSAAEGIAADGEQQAADEQQQEQPTKRVRFKLGFFSGILTNAQVLSTVSRITSKWANAPQIVVLKNIHQLPAELRERVMSRLDKDADAKGLFDAQTGVTYLFSDMMTGSSDVEFVLFHEVYGHLGLRAFLGERFEQFLENMYRVYPGVRKAADQMIEGGTPRLEAIEEVLSDLAANDSPIPAVKQFVGRIIAGMREIGLGRVADWIGSITNSELAFYLNGARDSARNGGYRMLEGAPGTLRFKEAQHERLYEMFSTSGGNTTAYARFNPVTQTWALFRATGKDIRQSYTASVHSDYNEVLEEMRKGGKVDFRKRSGRFVDDKLPGDMPRLTEITNISGVKRWMRDLIVKYQNEYKVVFDVVDRLREMGRLTDSMDVKTALLLYERKTGARIDYFRRHYVQPLQKLIEDAGKQGADYVVINEYLLARHAEERNRQIAKINGKYPDGGSGMKTQDALDILKDAQTKPYFNTLQEIGRVFDEVSRQKIRYLVGSGMITKKQAEAMSQYKHYVNLSGQEGDLKLDQYEDPGLLIGTKFNVKGVERRAMGRSTVASDIVANTILGMESAIIRGQKNLVAQKLLSMLEANYDPNFAVINEIAYERKMGDDGMVMEVEDTNYIRNKDVMVAKVNGIPVTIKFKDTTRGSFAEAIHGMVYPPDSSAWMERLGKFNQIIGQMLTTYNPVWVGVNFVRDAQTLYFNAATDGRITKAQAAAMVRMLPSAIKTAYYMAMTESGRKVGFRPDPEMVRVYNEMKLAGGMTSFLDRKGLEKQVADIDRLLGNRTKLQSAGDKFSGFLDFVETLTIPMEVAPRLAAYKVTRDNGFTQDQAAVFSGEITVNFNMRGANKEMRQLFLFFNPAVQGSAKLVDLARKNPGRMAGYVAAWAGVGMLANLIGRAFSPEDEDGRNALDKVPLYKRSTSIVLAADVPFGSIPIAYGWNAFFSLGHFMMDSALGIQPVTESAKRAAKATFEAFTPMGTAGLDSSTTPGMIVKGAAPTAVLPIVEWMLNENRFGAPIYKEGDVFGGAKLPDSQMAFRSVSPISKGITDTLNSITGGNVARSGGIDINPAAIDFFIGAYLPGFLAESYKGASVAARLARGEDVKNVPMPFVDRFTAKVPEGYDAGAFRRARELVETRYAEYDRYPQLRDELLAETPGLLRAHAVVASATQEIRKLRKSLTEKEKNDRFTEAELVDALNRTREREKQVYNRAVKAVMEAGPQFREAVMASD